MSELPKGWETSSLSQVVSKLVDGSHNPPPKQADGLPMLSARNILDSKIIFDDFRLIKQADFEIEDRRTNISPGDVLLTIVGAIGRTAIVPNLSQKFTLQRSVAVIRIHDGIDSEYLKYVFDRPEFQEWMLENAKGTAQKGIYLKKLGSTHIPVAPLNEQRRIVAKLDRLFARSRRAREELERVSGLCDRYRQAVLSAACSGRLTADWREQNPDVEPAAELLQRIYYERLRRCSKSFEAATNKGRKKPVKLKPLSIINADSFDIPVSWTLAYPEDIASSDDYSIGIGPFGSNLKVSDYIDSGIPLIFVRHIRTGDFSGQDPKYISLEKANELRPHTVEPLDLLITKMGEPPGDCEIYPPNRPLGVITSDCLKLRVWKDDLVGEYFKNCINSPIVKVQLGLITRGVAQQKISVERFKSVIFPVPPLAEQKEIVQRVEKLFKAIDLMEQEYQKASKLLDRLEQATLAKAFRGELVPQDPNDEPAAVLLERIQAERQEQPQGKAVKSKRKSGGQS